MEIDVTAENCIFCLPIGDWHLVPLGEETGEVTERLDMVVEGCLFWTLEVKAAAAGPSGLLKRLVKLGVLVGVGVSQGGSAREDSFGVCWTMTNIVLRYRLRQLYLF